MLILLAPSKTMNTKLPHPSFVHSTKPLFIDSAADIAATIKKLSLQEIEQLMKVSPTIAADVHAMYAKWQSGREKAALWAYRGDVYKGVKADLLNESAADWAQKHLLIMSGLYGIVRPFDAISNYRLEMKASLSVGSARNIYDFWSDTLANYVESHADGVVCNLSSDEYAKPVTSQLTKNVRVVTPRFYDNRPNGTVGKAPIYNKMMRGVMARWMIDHRIETPVGLKHFSGHGYNYDTVRSTVDGPAFYREKMTPLVF
jgi:hypothetical protein